MPPKNRFVTENSEALLKGETELRQIFEQGIAVGMNPFHVLAHANRYKRALGATRKAMSEFDQACGKLMGKEF